MSFFSCFYAFFSKISFRCWPYSDATVVNEISIRKVLNAKWVCEMNRSINCKSGTSFMGLAINAGISIWNEECSAYPH